MEQTVNQSSPGVVRALQWVAGITALLVLIQAVLIGQGLFTSAGLIPRHGEVGNLTFLAVIVLVVLAFLGWRRGAFGSRPLVVSVVLLVLVTAQIGLGYAGRESAGAASWHVPTGVLIFGLTVGLFGLVSSWARPTPTA